MQALKPMVTYLCERASRGDGVCKKVTGDVSVTVGWRVNDLDYGKPVAVHMPGVDEVLQDTVGDDQLNDRLKQGDMILE